MVRRRLQLLERLIEHDTFAPLQSLVREKDVFAVVDSEEPQSLRFAWTYACDVTQGMVVTACAWNKANPVRWLTYTNSTACTATGKKKGGKGGGKSKG